MLDSQAQQRFAQSCTDAAVGYLTAANAACLEMSRRSFDTWAGALASMAPKPEPRSWYRHPDERNGTTLPAVVNPFMPSAPFTSPFSAVADWQHLFAPWLGSLTRPEALYPLTMLAPWWQLATSQRAMAAWPMAFFMISIGIPEAVARPAAEANAAVLDASQVARGAVDRAFAAYRSDGGHAVAHVLGGERLVLAALLPFTTLPFFGR